MRSQCSATEIACHSGMFWISGDTFRLAADGHFAEEVPVHQVQMDPYRIDSVQGTNCRFVDPVDTSTSHVGFCCVVRQHRVPR
jgi:formylglycine-generating enzyme required for sulfatase activity